MRSPLIGEVVTVQLYSGCVVPFDVNLGGIDFGDVPDMLSAPLPWMDGDLSHRFITELPDVRLADNVGVDVLVCFITADSDAYGLTIKANETYLE